jgi:adenylate cyclase
VDRANESAGEQGRPARVGRLTSSARRLNRNARLLKAARDTRKWALGEQRLESGLYTARGRPADRAFRRLATLTSEEPGVAGELGAAVLQGWQRLAESQGRGRGEIELAVLFTDLVGFSAWALQSGDELAVQLLREVSEALEPAILNCEGEVVKRLGDGLMAVFRNASNAVEAALLACDRMTSVEVAGHRPRLRTGIHLGRPRKVGSDYLGVDVNIAARLAEAAQPCETLVSGRTLSALGGASVAASEREFSAKGTPPNLAVYAVWRA